MESSDDSSGLLTSLAKTVGASEPALRLLLSIFLGYPIAVVYQKYMTESSRTSKNLFLTVFGLLICVFNYGIDTYHSLIAILVTYILIVTLSNSNLYVPVSFAFHMGYLLIGYYYTTTDVYDIKWTMPHCVLVLRLIGLSFDISDGQKPYEKLSKDCQETAIQNKPGFLDLVAFTLFPASVLVGPQFSYKRYDEFISGKFNQYEQNFSSGLKRGAIGVLYLTIHQLGAIFVPDSYLLSPDYDNLSIVKKLLLLGVWGRHTLYKYISCWLIAEGAVICFGLSFVSKDEKTSQEDWSGCANIKLRIFENTIKFQHYIDSFNHQTNRWVAQYVYKRLKFLNNRHMSHFGALFFLALWHGFHSGYYMTFFMEFIVIRFEKDIEPLLVNNPKLQKVLENSILKLIVHIILRAYAFVFAGWCLVPFVFLSFPKWWQIYKTVYFAGFILFLPGTFVYKPLIKMISPKPIKQGREPGDAPASAAVSATERKDL